MAAEVPSQDSGIPLLPKVALVVALVPGAGILQVVVMALIVLFQGKYTGRSKMLAAAAVAVSLAVSALVLALGQLAGETTEVIVPP